MFGRKKKQQKKEEHRQAVRKGLLFWLPGGSFTSVKGMTRSFSGSFVLPRHRTTQ